MIRLLPCFAGALLFLAPPGASAGEPEPPAARLTLADAIRLARERSPQLAQMRSLEAAAAAALDGARAERRPFVDLSAVYTRYSDVPEFTLTLPGSGPRTLFPSIPDSYRTRLGMSELLYAGRRVTSGIAAAGGEREAAAKDVVTAEEDLVLEATAAYWSLVTARESEGALRDAVATFDAHLADARNRERFGMAARNEVLAVQVERDRAELARLRASEDAEVALADLVRLLGLPPASGIDPVEALTPPSLPEADVEALVGAALAARPERAAFRARLAAAESRIDVARSASRPQVSLSAGVDLANPNPRILPPEAVWKGTWSVGVGLALDLFDGGRTASAVARASAQADAIRAQIEDLDRRIRLGVTARLLDVRSAAEAVRVAERNVEAAAENRRVSRDRYEAGVGLSSDLLDAETALLRANLDRTESTARLRVALASLDRAVGR